MKRPELTAQIRNKSTYLCVGLDTDITKIPAHLKVTKDPVFEFNRAIIDATKDFCVSYKINTAFYEALGIKGWESLERTLHYIPDNIFKIADAKRGDIGNTSAQYAKTFFETYPFDAVTVAPYMGEDSIRPFLEYDNKWTILLALTSNKGANDFQYHNNGERKLYEEVLIKSSQWGHSGQLMYVVGATRPEELVHIRTLIPDYFLLVPGIGAQGGDLAKISEAGLIDDCGLLINASRSILFASSEANFAEMAGLEAARLAHEMKVLLENM